MSIARLDGGITESHGETRLQHLHLHLQLRSGRLHNDKRVGAHGSLHHLTNGGDFGFLERIPENRRHHQLLHESRSKNIAIKKCVKCVHLSLSKTALEALLLRVVVIGLLDHSAAYRSKSVFTCPRLLCGALHFLKEAVFQMTKVEAIAHSC